MTNSPVRAEPPDSIPAPNTKPANEPDSSADADAFKAITAYKKAHPEIPYWYSSVIDSHFGLGSIGPRISPWLILHISWSEDTKMKRIRTHSLYDHTVVHPQEKEFRSDISQYDLGGGRGGDGIPLSADKMKQIQAAMDRLPESASSLPEPVNLVMVSVKRDKSWKTYLYDRAHLPAEAVTLLELVHDPACEDTKPTDPPRQPRP